MAGPAVAGPATPLSGPEFAGLMAPLGPWDPDRALAVAVSGGADSLCLALLCRGWGRPHALIVDHGLRARSAEEAAETARTLAGIGVPSTILRLTGLAAGPALLARARAARYAALAEAASARVLADLLLAHHAADQAETVAIRSQAGSGAAGLAGMAAIVHADAGRLVRPFLGIGPARLRATLRHAGLPWIEDPSNADAAYHRGRLRRAPSAMASDPEAGADRQARERAIADELAARATVFAEGFARIDSATALSPGALAALLRAVGRRAYPPASAATARLAAGLRPATLAGVRLLDAGRLGPGLLLAPERPAAEPIDRADLPAALRRTLAAAPWSPPVPAAALPFIPLPGEGDANRSRSSYLLSRTAETTRASPLQDWTA